MTRVLAIIAALWCSSASAYLGTFDPQPYRNVVTIKFIDSQFAGASCAIEAAKAQPAYALLSPHHTHRRPLYGAYAGQTRRLTSCSLRRTRFSKCT